MDFQNKRTAPAIAVKLDLAWGLAVTMATALAAVWYWRLPIQTMASALVMFVFLSACVLRFWPSDQSFGPANRATLLRASLVITLLASAPFIGQLSAGNWDTQLWSYAVLALVALILDGVDGAIARAKQCESDFGARFDMELDAALILGLCIAVLALGKAGAWVLALGLMRYAFISAATVFHWLNAPLPDSFRRKTVCVWQIVTLMVAILPPVPSAFASVTLALALGLLAWSFARDIRWLFQRRFAHDCRNSY